MSKVYFRVSYTFCSSIKLESNVKVLIDSCVSPTLLSLLQTSGHDVAWTGNLARDPGDFEILNLAYSEQRVLITLDKDFGALAIRDKRPHTGIIRLVNLSLHQQGATCVQVLDEHSEILLAGAIITVDQERLRIRLPK